MLMFYFDCEKKISEKFNVTILQLCLWLNLTTMSHLHESGVYFDHNR